MSDYATLDYNLQFLEDVDYEMFILDEIETLKASGTTPPPTTQVVRNLTLLGVGI
jgi:hypothetical protein